MKRIYFLSFSVISTLLLSALLILVAGASPWLALQYFLYGIFGSLNGFMEILVKATPLIFIGLGISIAFRTGFFNIGGEGQFYMGALASAVVVILFPGLPGVVRVLAGIAVSFLAGGLWAFIPAYLKNRLGISETVNTIMFNYLAIMLVGISVRGFLKDPADYLPQSARIGPEASLPQLLPPTRFHLGFLLALVSVILVWFLMKHTTLGFEMRISGLNPRGAFCTGIPVQRSLLLSAVLSGGLAGMAGMNELLGVQHRLLEDLSGGNGYTAILIALLAGNNPLGVVLVSLCFAALQVGASTMQRQLDIPNALVSIITGFIVVLILGKNLIEIHREHRKQRAVHQ